MAAPFASGGVASTWAWARSTGSLCGGYTWVGALWRTRAVSGGSQIRGPGLGRQRRELAVMQCGCRLGHRPKDGILALDLRRIWVAARSRCGGAARVYLGGDGATLLLVLGGGDVRVDVVRRWLRRGGVDLVSEGGRCLVSQVQCADLSVLVLNFALCFLCLWRIRHVGSSWACCH